MASLDTCHHTCLYCSCPFMFFHVLPMAGACRERDFWIQASPFWRLGRGCRGDSV